MILIFFGPPGAGKGTQASLISHKLSIPHISTGEILRKKLLDTDSLSLKIKKVIDSGNLVSDDTLNELVSNRLNNLDCKNGFILD
jgi:adenylate kinase